MLFRVTASNVNKRRGRDHPLVAQVFIAHIEHRDLQPSLDQRDRGVHSTGTRTHDDDVGQGRAHRERRAHSSNGTPKVTFVTARTTLHPTATKRSSFERVLGKYVSACAGTVSSSDIIRYTRCRNADDGCRSPAAAS